MDETNLILKYKKDLEKYKNRIDNIEKEKIVETNNLKHLQEEEQKTLKEISDMGIDPNKIDEVIVEKTKALNDAMNVISKILPQDKTVPDNLDELLNNLSSLVGVDGNELWYGIF